MKELRDGECAKCGGGLTADHKCPSAVSAGYIVDRQIESLLKPVFKAATIRVRQIVAEIAKQQQEATKGNWVVHIIGPDDVIPQPDELTALRESNKINEGIARMNAVDHSENDPFVIAVAKNSDTEKR
ncbi:MAG TPA: hypothetical protein VI298_08610 [Geobacteraceae bacterium]